MRSRFTTEYTTYVSFGAYDWQIGLKHVDSLVLVQNMSVNGRRKNPIPGQDYLNSHGQERVPQAKFGIWPKD